MYTKRNPNLANEIDMSTEGALYALQYEAGSHGWEPHIWAVSQTQGRTRFFFYATDQTGRTRYFDHETIQDTGELTQKVLICENMIEARTAEARIRLGLRRLDQGLDPVSNRIESDGMD